jgi:hypothetical protein
MGFAAEIKEFLGAAKDTWKLMSDSDYKAAQTKYTDVKTAETQKEMDDPLNQKMKEAKLAHELATTANIGKGAPLSEWQRFLMKEAAKPKEESGPSTLAGAVNTVYGGKPAAPRSDDASPTVWGGSVVIPGNENPYGGSHAKGGLVRKFAVGGVVDDADVAPNDDEDEGALPPQAIPTAGTGLPVPQQRRPAVGAVPTPRPRPPELEAISDGLKYGLTQIPEDNMAVGMGQQRTRAMRAMAQGAGGAPPNEMLKIYRKIDPKGEMGESERNMHALQVVYQFKKNQGDSEGAAKAAFQMLQNYKTAAVQYSALAKAAIDGGHVDEGLKLAMKAYAHVPDGNDMKLYKGKDGSINWEAKDKEGNPISGGIATPDEIGTAAARLATPGQYENLLVQAVSGAKVKGMSAGAGAGGKGEDEEVPGAAGGGFKTSKPSEYKELKQEQIDKSVNDWHDAMKNDPKSKGVELTPKELASTKNMLFHLRANNQITDDEGLRRIQTIVTSPDPAKKGDPLPFRTAENKEARTQTIQFPDGGELTIPNTQIGMFKQARAEHFKEVEKAAKEAADRANRPGGFADAWEGVMAHREKARAETKELIEGAKSAYDTSTVKAVGGAAGRVYDEASNWLSKAGKTISEKGGAGAIGAGVSSVLGGGATAAPAPVNPDDDRPLP